MKIQLSQRYIDIISLNNLFLAWKEFVIGKKNKEDVQRFSRDLSDNILTLYNDLANRTYQHGGYYDFFITDPKKRHIHKASVRDRLLHHAIYRLLYPFFDRTFVPDSFSCRKNKGVHKALNRFKILAYQAGKSNHKTCWILKCDIKKFFDNIDHNILLNIMKEYVPDKDIIWLLNNVISSYSNEEKLKVGLPLGNLTSQLFANIYMNVLDQHVKHKLKAKYYIRYADDFAFFSDDKKQLENLIPKIHKFLNEKLKLTIHPDKISIQTLNSGVDFLGWVHFFNHHTLRKKTKTRMMKRIRQNPVNESLQSYLGLLQHGNADKIKQHLLNDYCLWGGN